MANQPYPQDKTGAVYDVPGVADTSYTATGLATEAGSPTNIPMPSGGHPAAYSGINPAYGIMAAGPDNPYSEPSGGTTGAGAPGIFMPGPSNAQPTGPQPEMGNNAHPGLTMAGPTDHYPE